MNRLTLLQGCRHAAIVFVKTFTKRLVVSFKRLANQKKTALPSLHAGLGRARGSPAVPAGCCWAGWAQWAVLLGGWMPLRL